MNAKQLLIGLPEAGKSTFLAALWHVTEGGRVESAMKVAAVEGDQQYLNEIRDAWSSCRPLERNRRGQDKLVSMKLVAKSDGSVVDLTLPDPAGESFSDQWELGRCLPDYVTLGREASGLLLFVNPGRIEAGLSIRDVVRAAEAARGGAASAEPAVEPRPWSPQSAGTQVQLVELIQTLRRPPMGRSYLPVAIIVSAWDQLLGPEGSPSEQLTPEEWLAQALPLLAQYLEMNTEVFPSRIYGVSAQGGDLARDRARLLDEPSPWKRVMIVGPDCDAHDLTAPLRWLLKMADPDNRGKATT